MRKSNLTIMTVLSFGVAMTVAVFQAAAATVDESNVYPLSNCPVTGQKLGSMGDAIVKEYDGREVRFCCKGCVGTFEKDKEKYFGKIDAEIVGQQKPLYPIETCLVSGGKLGGMGDPIEHVHNNRLVRFCCTGCVASFEKGPDKYLAKLDEAAVAKQKAAYPVDTCLVSGQKLGDEPVDAIVGGRLVRLCSRGCLKQVEKDPVGTLERLDAAAT